MSIIALYVYSTTTFNTDTKLEPMGAGAPLAAGEVKVPPGIYRLPGNANLVPTSGVREVDYSIVTLNGTKTGWPDPPFRAVQQHDKTGVQITNFLSGAGSENEI